MRPSLRAICVVLIVLIATVVIIVLPGVPPVLAVGLWAAVAVVMLGDLIASPTRRAVTAEIDLPEAAFTGMDIPMKLTLTPTARRLPAQVEARIEMPDGFAGEQAFAVTDGTGAVNLRGRLRGLHSIKSIWLRWSSPLRLWDIVPRWALSATVKVEPNIHPVSSGKIDAQVRMALFGVKDSNTKGAGSEFHQLRDFTTGMDNRMIDWKRSARRRDLVAREMRAEENHQVILCLDNGHLMREEIDGLPKIDHAINAALATAWAAGIGGDLVGIYSFDSHPRQWVPPAPGRAAFPRLRSEMAMMNYASVQSNPTLGLTTLSSHLSRRSLIIVFSDFVDTTTAELLIENIAVLNKSHLILFVAMDDPATQAIADAKVDGLDAVAEAVAASDMLRERQIVMDRLARMGVLVINTRPNALTAELISSYINIKARELL